MVSQSHVAPIRRAPEHAVRRANARHLTAVSAHLTYLTSYLITGRFEQRYSSRSRERRHKRRDARRKRRVRHPINAALP